MHEDRSHLCRKDIGYSAIFDLNDVPIIKKGQKMIQLGLMNPEQLFTSLERFHNDQTVYLTESKRFEPLEFAKSGNKLVNEGLSELAMCQVGGSQNVFGVYAIGSNNTAVSVRDDTLYEEVDRKDIRENDGTLKARGSTCYYSLFFPKTIATVDIYESAIVDSLDEGSDLMLLRTVFNTKITHVKDADAIFVGHVVYSSSV